MAGLGWLGITIPSGVRRCAAAAFLDLFPIYEEMGRFLVPSPHPRHASASRASLLSVGHATQQQESLLPRSPHGELRRQPRGRSRATARSAPGAHRRARQQSAVSDFVARRDEVARARSRRRPTCSSSRCARAATGCRRRLALARRRARRRASRATPLRNIAGNALYAVTLRRRVGAGRQPRRRRGRRVGAAVGALPRRPRSCRRRRSWVPRAPCST